jgi:tetratricopeptide (TPR) repeat protein
LLYLERVCKKMDGSRFRQLGMFFRKVRKERELTLDDLADENISSATISNIERGIPHVSNEKVLYLAQKLQIRSDMIPELLFKEKDKLQVIQQRIKAVDILLSNLKLPEAETILNKIKIDGDRLCPIQIQLLYAKLYMIKRNFSFSESIYEEIIDDIGNGPDLNNIRPTCFYNLGFLHFLGNDLNAALEVTNKGIEVFNHNGENKNIWYDLQCNKALFLEKLDEFPECLNLISDMWGHVNKIDETDTVLNIYWLRAKLEHKIKSGDIQNYIYHGMELAQKCNRYDFIFVFWLLSGVTEIDRERWEEAEFCIRIALNFTDKVSIYKKYNLVEAYSRLAIVCFQLNKYNDSLDLAKKAVEIGKEIGQASYLIDALITMGGLQKMLCNIEYAYEYYYKALILSRENRLKNKERKIIYKISVIRNDNSMDLEAFINHYNKVQNLIDIDKEDIFDELLER